VVKGCQAVRRNTCPLGAGAKNSEISPWRRNLMEKIEMRPHHPARTSKNSR